MKTLRRIAALALVALFCLLPAASASYEPIQLSADARYALNLFLSNFTEIGCGPIENYCLDDTALVDFAHDHLWFNDYDSFEYGEYFNDNNCRVADDRIQEIVDKYFYDPHAVDLTQTRFDYVDGYYYHCETGGWINSGFAQTVSVCPIGDDVYFVSFIVFGGGEFWKNDVLKLSIDQAEAQFGHPNGYGSALIHASDLASRSTYRMISYAPV